VGRDDVRVLQPGGRLDLAQEAPDASGVGAGREVHQLHRHYPVHAAVLRPVDRPHPSGADAAEQLVRAEGRGQFLGDGQGDVQPVAVQAGEAARVLIGRRGFAAQAAVVGVQGDELEQGGRPVGLGEVLQEALEAGACRPARRARSDCTGR
jgi:hypothetical protein